MKDSLLRSVAAVDIFPEKDIWFDDRKYREVLAGLPRKRAGKKDDKGNEYCKQLFWPFDKRHASS